MSVRSDTNYPKSPILQETSKKGAIKRAKGGISGKIIGVFQSKVQKSSSTESQKVGDNTNYLDKTKLLKGINGEPKIKEEHRDWYLNAAIYLSKAKEFGEKGDTKTQKKLEMAAFQGYSKAATVASKNSQSLGIQTSPFGHDEGKYHRSTNNTILNKANESVAQHIGIEDSGCHLPFRD